MDQLQPVEEIEDSSSKPPGTVAAVAAEELNPSISTKVVTDIVQAEALWRQWSPNQSLFDTWEFRYAFWHGYQYQPHFIVIRLNRVEIGLLPLWYENDKDLYTWFGSTWQEDNRFFTKDKKFVPLLLELLPPNTVLNAIDPRSCDNIAHINLEPDDPKYSIDIKNWTSVNPLLMKLTKKRRYNLRRDYRIISAMSPEIIIDNFDDFHTLRELNLSRFNTEDDISSWIDDRRIRTFEKIIMTGSMKDQFQCRMLTVKLNGIVAGVDLIAIYNNCYYPLVCGYNVEAFSGIGNFFTWIEIEDAISLRMHKIDVLEGNYGWKYRFFENQPLFKVVSKS